MVVASPFVKKVAYVDEDSSDLYVTIQYQLNSGTARLRLIVVSKSSNSDPTVDRFTDIEHYTDLDITKTEYTLRLETRFYKFVLEEIGSSGLTTHSTSVRDPLDLTNLSSRPTTTYKRSYRNSIVITTNIDKSQLIYRRDDPLYSFNFVLDIFDLDRNTAKSNILNNKNDSDVTLEGNLYNLHFCDLDVNTNYLLVYHTERIENDILYVSKDSDELTEATTNAVAEIEDLEGAYFTEPCYPNTSAALDSNGVPTKPTGIELSWTNSSGALYDPACPEEINVLTQFKVERKVYDSLDAYTTISSTIGDTVSHEVTYQDTTNLVEGTVYHYRLSAGVKDNDNGGVTTFGDEYYYIVIPFYTTPDKLVVTVTGMPTLPGGSSHVPHVKNSESGIQVNWTALGTADLNGYTIKDDKIYIAETANSGDTVEKLNSDLYHWFTGLSKGETYTKTLHYQTEVDDWHDLVQAATSPYGSPSTHISFVPYEDIAPVTDLAVSFDPVYTAYSASATASATLTWTAPEDCGLGGTITYTVTVKRTAVPEESITESIVYNAVQVTDTEFEADLVPGFNYTFTVTASQSDEICNITETSDPESVTGDALMLSSAVKNLSANYLTRTTSYPEPDSTAPVTAWDTAISQVNWVYIDADLPDHPSWRLGSNYFVNFIAPDETVAIGPDGVGTDSAPTDQLFSSVQGDLPQWDAEGVLADNTTYTIKVTPVVDGNNGEEAETTFIYYELPQITSVSLVVNRNQTMTASWDNFTNTNLRYDIFLKTNSDAPVFIHRITNNANSYVINKQYTMTNSLVSGDDYVVYVRAWRKIGSVAYISNAVASDTRSYFEDVSVSIPAYLTKTAIIDPIEEVGGVEVLGAFKDINGNALTLDINPTINYNGLDPDFVQFKLQYQYALTKGFNNSDDTLSDLFDTSVTSNLETWSDWNTDGIPTNDPVTDYAAISLDRLGYYKFRVLITEFKDPNTEEIEEVSITSNESEFFVISNPIIITETVLHTFTGTTDVLTAQLFNQWNHITSGLSVIVPNNQEKYRGVTLQQFSSSAFDDAAATNAERLTRYNGTGGLLQTFSVTYTNLALINRPIKQTFITVNNGVGLDYVYV
jgi:hypothetical protein